MRKSSTFPVLALTVCAFAAEPATRPAIPVSKDTTFLTGPLRADGTVNYVRGIEAALGEGVTPENNAFLALLQVTGVNDGNLSRKYKEYLIKRFGLKESETLWTSFKPAAADNQTQVKEITELQELYKKPWTREEFPAYAKYLADVDEPLAMVIDAVARPRFLLPMYGGDDDRMSAVLLPSLGTYRDIANVLTERATFCLGKRDIAGCKRDLLAAHRLGRLISQSHTTIELLVGFSIEVRAAKTDLTLAASGRMSAEDISSYLKSLAKLPDLRPLWGTVNFGDRCAILDEVTRMVRGGRASLVEAAERFGIEDINFSSQSTEHPDENNIEENAVPFTAAEIAKVDHVAVLKVVNAFINDVIAAMRIEDAAARAKALAEIDKRRDDARAHERKHPLADKDVTPAFGTWLIGSFTLSVARADIIENRARVQTDLSLVALALAAYKAEHKEYPEKLEPLAPAYLAKIPADRFSGKPLIYRRAGTGYILYSIGDDLKDDGGTPLKSYKGDIVVQTDK